MRTARLDNPFLPPVYKWTHLTPHLCHLASTWPPSHAAAQVSLRAIRLLLAPPTAELPYSISLCVFARSVAPKLLLPDRETVSVYMGNMQSRVSSEEIISVALAEGPAMHGTRAAAPGMLRTAHGWRSRLFYAMSFPVVLTVIVTAVIFTLSRKGIPDPDIWWHLHNADFLVHHHALPRNDLYSFTVPGHPWINHEWLAELPYYFAWRALGLSGINAMMFGALVLVFLGTLYLSYRETGHYKASIVAVSLTIFLGSVSFGPRTILFGYLYLLVLLILLQGFRQNGTAPLWTIPPLFCLWVNTHGSWLIGMLIFSLIIATGLIKLDWGFVFTEPWTRTQRKQLLATWIASLAALFVNPFGARLVFYPFDLAFRQKLNIEHVAEWVSVNFHDLRGKIVLAVLITLFLSMLLRPRRWTLAELGLVLFALYSGLTYIRFLFLVAIVIAPVLAKSFDFVPHYRREMDTPVVNACVIALIISGMAYLWPRERRLQQLVGEQYPVEAVAYLQAHPPAGRMLNFYLWGGYLNWRDPSLKVFVDSRVDIFEYSGVLADYLDILALKNPAPLLEEYKIRSVLFPVGEPLTYVLQHDPNWKVLYRDKSTILFERVDAETAAPVSHAAEQSHAAAMIMAAD
jgi:hypothetical protein